MLDGYGGIHPFGLALTGPSTVRPAPITGAPSWPGWDIARSIAILPNGTGGYVLDGFGGLHPFGIGGHAAPPVPAGTPYWLGWDIARSVALLRDGTRWLRAGRLRRPAPVRAPGPAGYRRRSLALRTRPGATSPAAWGSEPVVAS